MPSPYRIPSNNTKNRTQKISSTKHDDDWNREHDVKRHQLTSIDLKRPQMTSSDLAKHKYRIIRYTYI